MNIITTEQVISIIKNQAPDEIIPMHSSITMSANGVVEIKAEGYAEYEDEGSDTAFALSWAVYSEYNPETQSWEHTVMPDEGMPITASEDEYEISDDTQLEIVDALIQNEGWEKFIIAVMPEPAISINEDGEGYSVLDKVVSKSSNGSHKVTITKAAKDQAFFCYIDDSETNERSVFLVDKSNEMLSLSGNLLGAIKKPHPELFDI